MTGIDITLLASAGAAFLAVRRATRGHERRGGARKFLACAALATGAVSVTSTFAFSGTDAALMAPPAYGAILLSVGCALMAPRLLRGVLDRLPPAGASGWLAVRNLRERAGQPAGILMSLMLFTAVSTATLTMQAVANDTMEALYAATSCRGREFGQQRLAGAAPGQVLSMVGAEALILTVTGVFFGILAALAGIVPYTMVRTDEMLPGEVYGIGATVVAISAAVTLGTSLVTARRMLRSPAVGRRGRCGVLKACLTGTGVRGVPRRGEMTGCRMYGSQAWASPNGVFAPCREVSMHSRRILALMTTAPLMAALLTLGTAPTASAQPRLCAMVDAAGIKVRAEAGSGSQDDCIRVTVG